MATTDPLTFHLASGEACTIRVAEPRDAAGLIACTRATLEGPNAEFNVRRPEEFQRTEAEEIAWIEEHRERPGWIALIAEVHDAGAGAAPGGSIGAAAGDAGAVAGLINFKNGVAERIAHRGYFGLSVHPPWRGRGIGDALLAALLRWAEASPLVEKVCLAVTAQNTIAQALYRKHGFVEEGRHVRAIRYEAGRYDDDLAMYRWVGG